MKKSQELVKSIDLASGIGAGALGVGLGVIVGEELRPIAGIILILGALLHGWSMWRKHQLEKSEALELPHWGVVLYWLCWLALPAMAAIIVGHAAKGIS